MIGKLNTRITIKNSGFTIDEAGGPSDLNNDEGYELWAKVDARDGRLMTNEKQVQWSYNYKVTFRYERSRIVTSDMVISYDGKDLKINSISYENEGKRKFVVARCSVTRK